MALVAIDGTPLVQVGAAGAQGGPIIPGSQTATLDAAKEACIMIGQVFTEDGGSHTIDTTGSSAIGWRPGTCTFVNGGTTLVVGLAPVLTTAGPPARASHASDVISFDVSKSLTGGAGLTSGAWNEHVPGSGSKTIANGDLVAFAVQMTARGGADVVRPTYGTTTFGGPRPSVTNYVGGAYASTPGSPNAVITFSDGVLGFFFGGHVFTTTQSTKGWNSGSSPNEYGNFLQLPVPAKIYGIAFDASNAANFTGDFEAVLYSNPLGTPVAEKTVAFDLNALGVITNGGWGVAMFASPYQSTAGQPLAAIFKPTTVTSITVQYLILNASAHQKSMTCGANGYAVSRASGAFAAQNSSKDRFGIGLLVGAFDAGGGAAGGLIRHPGMNGGLSA